MAKHDVTATYAVALKGWQTKVMGSKVTAEQLTAAHALGCRPGKQALANAMYLRADGATDGQVKAACIAQWGGAGSQHNKRTDLANAKLVKVTKSKPGTHTVYAMTLTPKGEAMVKAGDTPAEPAAKAKRKATGKRKGNGGSEQPPKPETPTSDAPTGNAPVPVTEQPQA